MARNKEVSKQRINAKDRVRPKSVFEFVDGLHERYPGAYEDFVPLGTDDTPSESPVGSFARVEDMAKRVEQGLELWHPDDSHCFGEASNGRTMKDVIRDQLEEAEKHFD